jgi:hypothetical protein
VHLVIKDALGDRRGRNEVSAHHERNIPLFCLLQELPKSPIRDAARRAVTNVGVTVLDLEPPRPTATPKRRTPGYMGGMFRQSTRHNVPFLTAFGCHPLADHP